jgi:sulfur carrier protein ThiS
MTQTPAKPNPEFARLTLDKPLVDERIILEVAAGQTLRAALKDLIVKPGVAYVVMVNGKVVDQAELIQPGDEIRCLPQIVGGNR